MDFNDEARLREVFGRLLDPVSPESPCGPDLDEAYDPDYMALFASLDPPPLEKVVDGKLVRLESAPDWPNIARQSKALLARSKDIRLLEMLARGHMAQSGARGLEEALALLLRHLRSWPEDLHPRLGQYARGEQAAHFQAIQNFANPGGALSDIRGITFTSLMVPLKVGEVERGLSPGRPADAQPPEVIFRQLGELRARRDESYLSMMRAGEYAAAIKEHLETLYAERPDRPDLDPLIDLLGVLARAPYPTGAPEAQAAAEAPPDGPQEAVTAQTRGDAENTNPARGALGNRYAAAALIRKARCWFEENEPSSPIPILLRQAEAMVGKNFMETVQGLPLDIMEKWNNELT